MNEIKFNSPFRRDEEQVKTHKSGTILVLKVLGIIAAIIVIVALAFKGKQMIGGNAFWTENQVESQSYSAVFLTNDQVYFGKIKNKDNQEILLIDVYYLQLSGETAAQTQLGERKFSIVKLGNEIHGPTDEMFINMQNVLFYENLKNDSKVLEAIKNYQQK